MQSFGRTSVARCVGHTGQLVVTRDMGLEDQYQGMVPMTSGEIDEDLEHYLTQSEQLPSVMSCEVVLDSNNRVLRAAGVLCQTFPEAPPDKLEPIRETVQQLHELLLQDRNTRELMGFALLGAEFESMKATDLRFACSCGHERALNVVSALGAEDIDALAEEPGDTEVRCSYCGTRYLLTPVELHDLADRLRLHRS